MQQYVKKKILTEKTWGAKYKNSDPDTFLKYKGKHARTERLSHS